MAGKLGQLPVLPLDRLMKWQVGAALASATYLKRFSSEEICCMRGLVGQREP
jgi:hypothetical protein